MEQVNVDDEEGNNHTHSKYKSVLLLFFFLFLVGFRCSIGDWGISGRGTVSFFFRFSSFFLGAPLVNEKEEKNK